MKKLIKKIRRNPFRNIATNIQCMGVISGIRYALGIAEEGVDFVTEGCYYDSTMEF